MSTSPNLGLAYLVASQAQKEVTHNEAVNDLDCLVQLSVTSRTVSVPPVSPVEGACYIVGPSPTGAWSGQSGKVAFYFSGWHFKTPKSGWIAFVQSETKFCAYSGSSWALLGGFV